MIRPLHPMDMPSYLAFVKRACRGEGIDGGEHSRASRNLLDFLTRSLTLETPRQTWVYAEGRSILGMVAVKSRPGSAAWEVNRFLGADCPDADLVLEHLLEHLAGVGGEEGIQKLFLRLPTNSDLLPVARRAGFFVYARERVYSSAVGRPGQGVDQAPFRPRRVQDHLALFEHYGRVAPVRTRQAEAMTLQEWRWLDGWQPRRHFRVSLERGSRDYVWWDGAYVFGWLRLEPRRRLLRVTLDPMKAHAEHADAALSFASSKLAQSGTVYVPVRDYEPVWEEALLRQGAELAGEYSLLVKQLTVRVGEHCLVPVGA